MGLIYAQVSARLSNQSSTVDPSKSQDVRVSRSPTGLHGRMETSRRSRFGKAPSSITHLDRPRLEMTHRPPGGAFTAEPHHAAEMHAHRSRAGCELIRGDKLAFGPLE